MLRKQQILGSARPRRSYGSAWFPETAKLRMTGPWVEKERCFPMSQNRDMGTRRWAVLFLATLRGADCGLWLSQDFAALHPGLLSFLPCGKKGLRFPMSQKRDMGHPFSDYGTSLLSHPRGARMGHGSSCGMGESTRETKKRPMSQPSGTWCRGTHAFLYTEWRRMG